MVTRERVRRQGRQTAKGKEEVEILNTDITVEDLLEGSYDEENLEDNAEWYKKTDW